MNRGLALLERLWGRDKAAVRTRGRPRKHEHDPAEVPAPATAADKPIDEMDRLVQSLTSLSPKKQVAVGDRWPGAEIALPSGLTVTVRSSKERRRFVRPIDEEVLQWFRGFEPGDVFYDIGANCGSLTLATGAMHRDRITVVAIEPGFANFDSLARNLSQNGMLGFVIPLQIALLDRTGLEAINYYRSAAAGTSLHAVGGRVDHEGREFVPVETQTIPTYTLDDLIDVLKLPPPTRVKIDVDGTEGPLLRGAAKTLAGGAIKDLLVEIVDHDQSGTRLSSVRGLMESHGYELAQSFRHPSSTSFVADYLFCHSAWRRRRGGHDAADGTSTEQPALEVTSQQKGAPPDSDDQTSRAKVAAAQERAAQKIQAAEAKVAAAQERAARKAQGARDKYERERQGWAERLSRMRAELDELRESYYLSGAGKKVDLRELEGFSEIAGEIVATGRTRMNYDRLYTLWQAVHAAPPEKPIIEIGTYRGGSARFISETLMASDKTPRVYVCDTFAGHAQTDPTIDTLHHDAGKFEDVSAESTARYLSGYPALELIVGDIVETAPRLDEDSFGFVHLDVDVYPTTHFCLRFFAPRLADGGVMVIDDYGVTTCPGVKQAADEFVAEFPQFRLWHLLTGQAILSPIVASTR